DTDLDLVHVEVREQLVADRLGQRLEEAEGRRFDDLADRLVDLAVVDRALQVVVDPGRLEVEEELDVDLERLRVEQLVVVVAVPALEAHVREHDAVAQERPPSIGSECHVPRTIASLMRATRTFARTSWTRTRSAP